MDESTRGQNIKTCQGMTDIKIRVVVDSREGRREKGKAGPGRSTERSSNASAMFSFIR